MEILVDAPVVCSDGATGHVSALIMNPLSNELTHMVVRQTGLLGIERLVPVTFILEATPEEIVLNCTLAELAEQPPFVVYELIQGSSYVDVELPDTPLNWLGNGSETGNCCIANSSNTKPRSSIQSCFAT